MFQPALPADLPAIADLMNRAYRGGEGEAGWTSEGQYIGGPRTTPELLAADIAETPGAVMLKWVEAAGEALSGCVWLEPVGEAGVWYLGSLASDPGRQNSGMGRRLLAAAEDWVRAHGGTRVRMTVINVREALIAWYVRRGYAPTGEIEPFPYGDNRLGTPLRDDLAFVVLERALAG